MNDRDPRIRACNKEVNASLEKTTGLGEVQKKATQGAEALADCTANAILIDNLDAIKERLLVVGAKNDALESKHQNYKAAVTQLRGKFRNGEYDDNGEGGGSGPLFDKILPELMQQQDASEKGVGSIYEISTQSSSI